jgi:hypothetical protein
MCSDKELATPRRRHRARPRVRGACATVVTLLVATAVSLVALRVQCDERDLCADLCVPSDDVCGFETRVSASVLSFVGGKASDAAMLSADRGVCAPGTRQSRVEGRLACRRADYFPSALARHEIGDETGDRQSARSCGAWTASLPAPWPLEQRPTRWWSFWDEEAVRQDVVAAIRAKAAVGASSPLQTFGRVCVTTWSSNALGQSVRQGYVELVARAFPKRVETVDEVVRAIGTVAGNYCAAPVAITLGHTRRSSGVETTLLMLDGDLLSAGAAAAALRAVGASPAAVTGARSFAEAAADALEAAARQQAHAEEGRGPHAASRHDGELATRSVGVGVGVGSRSAAERSVVAGALGIDFTPREAGGAAVDVVGELHSLDAVLSAIERTSLEAGVAFVKALAAECAVSAGTLVSRSGSARTPSTAAVHALGRLPERLDDRMPALSTKDLAEAAKATFNAAAAHLSSQRMSEGHGDSQRHAEAACANAAAVVFAEHTERAVYELFVGPVLERRVKELVPRLREAVARTVTSPPFSSLFVDGGARFAEAAQNAEFRIAGAPAGVFSSEQRVTAQADVASDDRPVSILVKQARELFLSRADAAREGGRCDIPTLMPATSRNAYFLTSAGCVVVLPGLVIGPFAGRNYDDESLVSRLGYVIAHEFAHVTSDTTMWRPQTTAFLSKYYSYESTFYEGLADLVAVAAVVSTNLTTASRLCEHTSEIWCGKAGNVPHTEPLTHPPVNARGDAICAFLSR